MPSFWDFATVSSATINLQPGAEIIGRAAGDITGEGTVNGKTYPPREASNWPDTQVFKDFYWTTEVINNILPSEIDVGTITSLGPGHSVGNLNLKHDNTDPVVLNGTVYVKGDLTLAENKDYTLDLNYQTIFVEGNIVVGPERPTIEGSGCIIAIGDITYQPNIITSEDDFVYLMSIESTVYFAPQNLGQFYGCIAGKEFINGQPNATFIWTKPPVDKLNFPSSGDGVDSTINVRTWEID
jgi:hypothetical protein